MRPAADTRRALVVQHLAFEDLGVFAPVLREAGYALGCVQAGVDTPAPGAWLAPDLVVVLGGPIGVGDLAHYPWLAGEVEGLRRRLAARRPTLGICLGAQLIAAALGARVHRGTAVEIGWSALTLHGGEPDALLQPLADTPVLHWHGDTFALPAGARLLASTAITPHQAFACGDHALALQCHPEFDPTRLEAWLVGHAVELRQHGIDLDALRADTRRHGARAASAGAAALRRWLARLPAH